MGHREQLLDAARRLLVERGSARITARDLVAESGTNLGSIGYHFGSKDALINAAIEAAFDDWAENLTRLVMSDPDATPIERGMATWLTALDTLPERKPILAAFVDCVAQAQRVPALRAQLAEHYNKARTRVAELVAVSLGNNTPADDPRCRAIASFVIAVLDGLALQWLIDPDHSPSSDELRDGLMTVWTASFGADAMVRQRPPVISRTAGRTSVR